MKLCITFLCNSCAILPYSFYSVSHCQTITVNPLSRFLKTTLCIIICLQMSQESQESEAEFLEAEEGSNVGEEDGESCQSPQSKSPYDDSDGDVDYNPAKDDDAGDDSDSDKDDEFEDLLSNPNIP